MNIQPCSTPIEDLIETWSFEKRIPSGFPAMLKASELSFAKEMTTINQSKPLEVRELSL